MPPLDLLLPFLLATAVFSVTPGPGLAYMAVQTMVHGPRAGWYSLAAFHLGSCLHIALAAFGVTALLAASPGVLVALKIAGAGYLVWMGLRMFLGRGAAGRMPEPDPRAAPRRAFRDTLVLEVLSPESALFFFVFLPQFVSVEAGWPVWAQVLALGAIANTVFSLADAGCVLASRAVAERGRLSGRARVWGCRFGGAILVALGVRVAVSAA